MTGFALTALHSQQLDTLHVATLRILEEVGIAVELPEAAERFDGAGAHVTSADGHSRVSIPPHLVESCIQSAPKSVTYWGQVRASDYATGGGRVGFATFGECVTVFDHATRELRSSTKADCEQVARVVDSLEQICVMQRTLCPGDQLPASQPLHSLHASFPNTTKHVFLGAGNRRCLNAMVTLGEMAVGDSRGFRERPVFSANVCPTSPLTLGADCCQVVIRCAELGVGISIVPMGLSGGTSPVTLGGAIVQHNAEVLCTLVLQQITQKGSPATYGSCSTIMDLRSAVSAVGAPETGVISALVASMAAYYGLPSWVNGGVSDAKVVDSQVGYEFAVNALTAALARPGMVYGAGALESGLTFDYGKLMMDCECIRNIQKVLDGVTLDDDLLLALEVVAKVGPGGTYLAQKHTRERMRSQSSGSLFDRRSRGAWSKAGAEATLDGAYRAAADILQKQVPSHLPDAVVEDMGIVIRDFEEAHMADPEQAS